MDDELAIAEARLMIAACAYVDASERRMPLEDRKGLWDGLRAAVYAYRDALQGPPLPADHPLVARGMRVVRRLLERG